MTRVAFATLGCRVNQADTQELQGRLEAGGCQTVPFDADADLFDAAADVVVVNTCAVTARAEFSDRQLIRRAVRRHPNARIVVTGCWAQIDPDVIATIPGVDLVVGLADRDRLGVLIDGLGRRSDPGEKTARPAPATQAPASQVWASPATLCTAPGSPAPGDAVPGASATTTPGTTISAPVGAAGVSRSPRDDGGGVASRIHVTDVRAGASMEPAPFARVTGRSRAFLKIQDGCQHRCAFCIVPLARGPSRSRQPEAIIDQARALVEAGHPEIVLTGVDLGHYGVDLTPRMSLAALLQSLDRIRGLRWVRLSSVLPAYFTPDLLEAVVGLQVVAPHLHVPLQSGSDRVLRRMRRPYNTAIYARLVERLAEAIPGLGLGTDLIAGFPGETDADAAQTEAFVAALPFSYLHVFTYSDRKGTEAVRLSDHVPTRVIAERGRRLRGLGETKARAFRERVRGTSQEVLVLGTRDRRAGRLTGLTGNYVEVLFDGADSLMGRLVSVRITTVQRGTVEGELVA
jgi:threonylcarbamoyladenosine tRNA methylthiotransferase MtaB